MTSYIIAQLVGFLGYLFLITAPNFSDKKPDYQNRAYRLLATLCAMDIIGTKRADCFKCFEYYGDPYCSQLRGQNQ